MGKRPHHLLSVVAISFAVLAASPSWATTVQPGIGNLTINQGQGFKPVTGQLDANVGDSVMVGPGGSATVVYEDGCKVDVQPGGVTTIAPLSPCASGSNAQVGWWDWCHPDLSNPQNNNCSWAGTLVAAAALAAIITIPIVGSQHHGFIAPKPGSP
jgi:hypothetical protein